MAIITSWVDVSAAPPLLPGVLSEHITVNDRNYLGQINVIGQIPIIGRGAGPILQDMATTEVKSRTLTIEAVLSPTGGNNLLSAYLTKPTGYEAYAIQLKPTNAYTTNWLSTYDWKLGHFALNCEWLYE